MMSLKERPGYLRLKGRESLNSCFEQSLVARRQQAFCYTASTCVEYEPTSFKHMAGLVCYYSTHCFHYLKISYREEMGKCIEIMTCDNDEYRFPMDKPINVEGCKKVYLRVDVDYDRLQFFYSKDGTEWVTVGPILDASILSDEHILLKRWAFTGAFVGMCCQDMLLSGKHADFGWFEYIER
jgi:xylan 1,4-beta-xylosidase